MAQFRHPEFGGTGQWMRCGMIMIGEMFNNTLKARVEALCNDIAQRNWASLPQSAVRTNSIIRTSPRSTASLFGTATP
jgi:hypothetical protein